jgi:uncharacterized protein YraI
MFPVWGFYMEIDKNSACHLSFASTRSKERIIRNPTMTLFLIMALMFAHAVNAQDATQSLTVITNQQVNFRAGSSRDWSVYAIIAANTPLIAVARTSDSNWLQIRYQAQTGWVASWLVIWEGGGDALAALPVLDIPPPPAPYEPPFVTTQDYSALRAGPGIHFERIAVVPPEITLTPIGRTANYGWYQVEYEGQRGWIIYWLLVWTGDIETLPIDGIDPVPFIRIFGLPAVATIPVDRYTRFRGRVIREITAGLEALASVENAWRELETIGSTVCISIETVGFRALPEALLQGEVVYFPLVEALQTAFSETNAAIAQFDALCSRPDAVVTQRNIILALERVQIARRYYILATALVNGFE